MNTPFFSNAQPMRNPAERLKTLSSRIKAGIFIDAAELVGIDLNQTIPPDNRTLLHLASMTNKDNVSLLLRTGAEINTADNNNWTPLHVAALHKQLDIIQILIAAGADKTIKTNSFQPETAKEIAQRKGAVSIVEYFESIEAEQRSGLMAT